MARQLVILCKFCHVKPVPSLALENNDPYCTRVCAEKDAGTYEANHHSGAEIFGRMKITNRKYTDV